MLGDEDGVRAHRRLAAVVLGPAFFGKILLLLMSQTESAAKLAAGESGEELVEIAHWLSRYRVDRSNCIVSISGLSSATS